MNSKTVFRKKVKDGVNIIICAGRLIKENVLAVDENGSLKEYTLTNEKYTEYNDVYVCGFEKEGNEITVIKMESLPLDDKYKAGIKANLSLDFESEDNHYIYPVLNDKLTATSTFTAENGNKYTNLTISLDKNDTFHFKAFGEITEDKEKSFLLLIMKQCPKIEKKEFGKGYAIKKVTMRYGSGVCLYF